MKDTISQGLTAALDLAVFRERRDGSFEAMDKLPGWYFDVDPVGRSAPPRSLDASFPFLEPFLVDVRKFWAKQEPGQLSSGPWAQPDVHRVDRYLEATAVFHRDERLLLIHLLGQEFEQVHRALQQAREQALAREEIIKAGRGPSAAASPGPLLVESLPDALFRLKRDGSYEDLTRGGGNGVPTGPATISETTAAPVAARLLEEVGKTIDARTSPNVFEFVEGAGHERRDLEAWMARCGGDEALVLVRDISDRKAAERDAAEALRRLEAERDELLSTLEQLRAATLPVPPRGDAAMITAGTAPRHTPGKNGGRFPAPDVSELHELHPPVGGSKRFDDIVGASEPMRQIYGLIEDLAPIDATVLIEGETGAGKELVARALHRRSVRSGPFVVVNCAGLTESLVASQLFGHRRGAFTGAVRDQTGVFEAAHGGTVFLDEIGDIPPAAQRSLLRVLQHKEVTRLGDNHPRKVDVRILAATHRSLTEEVEQGRFRADLLYRIRVTRIRVPALRERTEDIPLLVAQFVAELRTQLGKPVQGVSRAAMQQLMDHPWPGNIRELRSLLEFGIIRARHDVLDTTDLTLDSDTLPTDESPADDRTRFLDALHRAEGNRAKAARLLGVSRATFYRRRAELGIALP